jgi:hypothetical protein
MKAVATLAAVMMLGAATPALAQYQSAPPPGAVMPPYEVLTIVRSMGFDPMSRPVLRGPVYVVRALDDDDIPVRVAIDARSGQVVRVTESGINYPGSWPGVRSGAYVLPPETVPPGERYLPPREFGRQVPPPHKLATRTPIPRAAPPQSRAAVGSPGSSPGSAAAMADPKTVPGKSVPAPVGGRPPTSTTPPPTNADQVSITEATSPTTRGDRPAGMPELKPTELVPVAPLE